MKEIHCNTKLLHCLKKLNASKHQEAERKRKVGIQVFRQLAKWTLSQANAVRKSEGQY